MIKKTQKKREIAWWQFFVSISVAIILFILGIFIGLVIRNNHLINQEILTRAKAHINHIVMTREWNAHYSGVYVEKKDGVVSSPYLENPDIKSVDGKTYTLKNPALMTREISELFEKDGQLVFHMTSQKPLNPNNKPDEFEKNALTLFEKGNKEVYSKAKAGNRTSFRYMVPLFVDDACLKCHAKQGYKPGDIRGGISVEFDITKVEESMVLNDLIILLLGSVAAITLLGIIYAFVIVLKRKLDTAHKVIEEMAIIDDLTGLHNRRYFFKALKNEKKRAIRFEQDMGCAMLDVDNFKGINDRYGHNAGDMVLKKVAEVIMSSCRQIDVVARYGGEEFVLLLPGTGIEGVSNVSEKIRGAVEKLRNIYAEDHAIFVTVSVGIAAFAHHDLKNISDNDLIVKKADEALYRAKELGRNRVEKA